MFSKRRTKLFEVMNCIVLLVLITTQGVVAATQDSLLLESEPFHAKSPDQSPTRFVKLNPSQIGIGFVHRQKSEEHTETVLSDTLIGGGVCIGDYDGDHWPDVVLTRPVGGPRLYRNLGGFRFRDVTRTSGLGNDKAWSTGASFADLDGDGDLDLFICGYAAPNRLYINQGNGRFVEKGHLAGLDYRGASTMMSFADIDCDGDLDGYLVTYRLYGHQKTEFREGRFTNPEDKDLLVQPDGKRMVIDAGEYDHLYLNNGDGTFADISQQAGIVGNHLGLSATWWDYNHDGYPDLYVANDYWGPDHLYRNNHDGTFTDVVRQTLPHVPWYSMGTDLGDINNDGLFDFVATDMAATDHYKQKVTMGDMADSSWFLTASDPPQYMRNAVYLNTGTDRCMEVAKLTGLSSTDWTWSVKFGDFDNDGWLDLFVTNGMTRDYFNADVLEQMKGAGLLEQAAIWDDQPRKKDNNLAFRNRGNLEFTQVQDVWGLDLPSVSYGAGLADLDRDGDLDIIVNNFEQPPTVYRNTTVDGDEQSHAITVKLRGSLSNRHGIGATVHIQTAAGVQARYLTLARGYISTNEPMLHFGLGSLLQVERLTVTWPSGQIQTYRDLAVDHHYTISEPRQTTKPVNPSAVPALFARSERLSLVDHLELPYNDYQDQPLLPHKLSQLGPGMAWGDVDGDRDADLFVGQAAGHPGFLYINQGNGDFVWTHPRLFEADQESEDMGALFFDADGDGDLDLYVVSGGYQYKPQDPRYRDRLYLNDGQGYLKKSVENVLPDLRDSGGTVIAGDIDRDGDLDLFVGGRVVPGKFPVTPRSYLLQNDGGRFVDVAPSVLAQTGLVTSALFSDVDNDGWLDLLVTHEWGPVRVYRNTEGVFSDKSSAAGTELLLGWFHGIAASDLDADGDIDYVVTNVGLNTKYHASSEKPIMIHYGDFGGDGVMRLVEADYENERLFPMRGKSCSTNAMPFLGKRFNTYHDFAIASLTDIYTPQCLNDSHRLEANTLESGVFLNDGYGLFSFQPLPRLAQASTSYGCVVTEVNGDGIPDLYLAQNFFGPQPETGRYDGGISLLLTGNGDGTFTPVPASESGLVVHQDAMGLATSDINRDGKVDFVLSVNNGQMHVFENQQAGSQKYLKLTLQGPPGNSTAIGSRITVRTTEGPTQTSEIYAGGSYLSQSTNELFFGLGNNLSIETITVRWPDGTPVDYDRSDLDLTTDQLDEALVITISHSDATPTLPGRDPIRSDSNHSLIEAHLKFATALVEQDHIDRAIRHQHHVVSIDSNNVEAHVQLAESYGRLRDVTGAKEHYQKAMNLHPQNANYPAQLAAILLANGKTKSANRYYETALNLESDHVTAHVGLAQISMAEDQTKAVLKHVNSALAISPNHREARLLAGKASWRTGNLGKAKSHFVNLLRHDIDDHDAHFYLGHIFARQRNTPNMIRHFKRYVRQYPHNVPVQKLLAAGYASRQQWQDAADHYAKAVKLDSLNEQLRCQYAHVLQRLKQFESARVQCEFVLDVNPKSAEAHNLLGQGLASLGQNLDAIKHFDFAVRVRPDFVEAHTNRATVLFIQGNFEQAVAGYHHALQLDADHSGIHRKLGQTYEQMGNHDQALHHLRRSIQLNPQDAKAHERTAMILVRGGRVSEALEYLRKVAQLDPTSAEAQFRVGLACYRLRRHEDAIVALRQGLKIAPENSELSNLLAWVLAVQPDTSRLDAQEAVSLAERVVEQTERKNPIYLDTLAAAYAATGEFDKAIDTVQLVISLTPPDKQKILAQIHGRLKQYLKQQRYVEKKR